MLIDADRCPVCGYARGSRPYCFACRAHRALPSAPEVQTDLWEDDGGAPQPPPPEDRDEFPPKA